MESINHLTHYFVLRYQLPVDPVQHLLQIQHLISKYLWKVCPTHIHNQEQFHFSLDYFPTIANKVGSWGEFPYQIHYLVEL